MSDRAYIVSRTLENKIAIAENNDLNTVLVSLIMMKEILAILKDQKDTINELQNAYSYLQKQFFKAQDKLLKKQEKKKLLVDSDGDITPLPDREQDYRTWIIDMFHKYNRDDLIALMVQKGEESILAGLLKEQEPVAPNVSSTEQRCGNCNKIIEMDGWIACPWCGKPIAWNEWWNKNARD